MWVVKKSFFWAIVILNLVTILSFQNCSDVAFRGVVNDSLTPFCQADDFNIVAPATPINSGDTVTFSVNPMAAETSYNWKIEHTDLSNVTNVLQVTTAPTITLTFTQDGSYTVTATAERVSCDTPRVKTYSFSINTSSVCPLSGLALSGPDSGLVLQSLGYAVNHNCTGLSFLWDTSGGVIANDGNAFDNQIDATWGLPGIYVVSSNVTRANPEPPTERRLAKPVSIRNNCPTLRELFISAPDVAYVSDAVPFKLFVPLAACLNITSINWDFGLNSSPTTGTGTGLNLPPLETRYSLAGEKTVKATVVVGSETIVLEHIIKILDSSLPPCDDETLLTLTGPTVGYIGDSLRFGVYVPKCITANTFTWDFKDGTTGTGQTISHTFATAGIYLVKVAVATQDHGIINLHRRVVINGPTSSCGSLNGKAFKVIPTVVEPELCGSSNILSTAVSPITGVDVPVTWACQLSPASPQPCNGRLCGPNQVIINSGTQCQTCTPGTQPAPGPNPTTCDPIPAKTCRYREVGSATNITVNSGSAPVVRFGVGSSCGQCQSQTFTCTDAISDSQGPNGFFQFSPGFVHQSNDACLATNACQSSCGSLNGKAFKVIPTVVEPELCGSSNILSTAVSPITGVDVPVTWACQLSPASPQPCNGRLCGPNQVIINSGTQCQTCTPGTQPAPGPNPTTCDPIPAKTCRYREVGSATNITVNSGSAPVVRFGVGSSCGQCQSQTFTCTDTISDSQGASGYYQFSPGFVHQSNDACLAINACPSSCGSLNGKAFKVIPTNAVPELCGSSNILSTAVSPTTGVNVAVTWACQLSPASPQPCNGRLCGPNQIAQGASCLDCGPNTFVQNNQCMCNTTVVAPGVACVNGACVTPSPVILSTAAIPSPLCLAGNPNPNPLVVSAGSSANYSCDGLNGGLNAPCTIRRCGVGQLINTTTRQCYTPSGGGGGGASCAIPGPIRATLTAYADFRSPNLVTHTQLERTYSSCDALAIAARDFYRNVVRTTAPISSSQQIWSGYLRPVTINKIGNGQNTVYGVYDPVIPSALQNSIWQSNFNQTQWINVYDP